MSESEAADERSATSVGPLDIIKSPHKRSKAFALMEHIFDIGPQDLELGTRSEKLAMQRLVKAGLVTAEKYTCIRYSLTLSGRSRYAAAELGLSFSQFCYLACARAAISRSFLSRESAFFAKDLHPMFRTLFPDSSSIVIRKELTQKGFLVKRVRHVSAMTRRTAQIEEKYAGIMDELYHWMKVEYKRRLIENMKDPAIARLVGLMPQEYNYNL